ncbi:MAG: hypothetical protein ACYCSN_00575 [Acidobacteriaceae bacterium]
MHTVLMGFRATVASLLAVVVFAIASLASVCEIQCDLKEIGATCSHKGLLEQRSHDANAVRSIPGMQKAVVAQAVQAISSECDHEECAQPPALTTRQNAVAVIMVPSYHAVVLLAAMMMHADRKDVFLVQGSPPREYSSPVTLHTILRV